MIISQTPQIALVSPYHSWIIWKNEGKGADKDVGKLGSKVGSPHSVHHCSTFLPYLFSRQNFGHCVSTTTPPSLPRLNCQLRQVKQTKLLFTSHNPLLRVLFKKTLFVTTFPTQPPTFMSQTAYNNTGLGSVQNHLSGQHSSNTNSSLSQNHPNNSQPHHPPSHPP